MSGAVKLGARRAEKHEGTWHGLEVIPGGHSRRKSHPDFKHLGGMTDNFWKQHDRLLLESDWRQWLPLTGGGG